MKREKITKIIKCSATFVLLTINNAYSVIPVTDAAVLSAITSTGTANILSTKAQTLSNKVAITAASTSNTTALSLNTAAIVKASAVNKLGIAGQIAKTAAVLSAIGTQYPFIMATAENTGNILQQAIDINKNLKVVNDSIINNRIVNQADNMMNMMYGQDKLSGSTWIYRDDGSKFEITELNFSNGMKDLLNHYKLTQSPIPFNFSNVLFHEELGMATDYGAISDFGTSPLNNLDFEIKVLQKLAKIKAHYVDEFDKNNRITDYMNKIDDTQTIKSSIDFGNLLALESLVQQRFLLEAKINADIINLYNNIKKTSTGYTADQSSGTLPLLPITH
ncbi:MAG: hypothetical protein OXE99_02170 [Cellvibrionales bacterium]|nr:hypothetical protein [Cellvibrionales bacterium]